MTGCAEAKMGAPDLWAGKPALLVPVKAFAQAKVRLAPALGADARRRLARAMASRVVAAACGLPTAVVCDDDEVSDWASSLGALVLWAPNLGLNGAVQEGFLRLSSLGATTVIVAAGDLPQASDLRWAAEYPGITLVPDRRQDGTNVVALPARSDFAFAYGPGSFRRHLAEARRVGARLRVVHSSPLSWDVDLPEDLAGAADLFGAIRGPAGEEPGGPVSASRDV